MTHAVIIGAGLGGLACALFLARRGHEVDLFERDGDDPPADPPSAFASWTRRGLPQARQGHGFLGLSSEVLKTAAPDVLDRLVEAGASVIDMTNHPLPQVKLLAVRRLVYEAVLRQAVAAETRVRIHRGATVDGLIAEPGSSPPRVIGLRTAAGQDCRGDLVIDASGRWTKGAEWLAAVGARPWRDDVSETPFVYVTRHYRLKAGEVFPVPLVASSVDLSYGGATTFKGDDGAFAMAFLTSTFDPYRGALTKADRFHAVMEAIPAMAAWTSIATPINEPLALGRIDNRLRSLVDGEGPVASGYVLLGDAAMHTNPVFARGVSLAYAQARQLAATIEQQPADPLGYAVAFEAWTREHINVWYPGSVQADLGKAAQMARSCRGEDAPAGPMAAVGNAMWALAINDPDLARRWARLNHLLDPPAKLFGDPTVMSRVQPYVAGHQGLVPDDALSRGDFEAIVTA
jgi:2-polyprenyl-6-methoxyphenol hydroxylase-like FAD-dependent oxidoreductase